MRRGDGIDPSIDKRSRNLGIFLFTVSITGLIIVAVMGRAQLMDFASSILNPEVHPAVIQNPSPAQHVVQNSGTLSENNSLEKGSRPAENVTSANQVIETKNFAGFNRTNFAVLLARPDSYAGFPVSISGKVYDLANLANSQGDILTLKIRVDAINSNDAFRSIVFYQGPHGSAPNLQTGACVFAKGTVRGSIFETASLGKSILVPAIDSRSLNQIPCIDSSMPAQKTVDLHIIENLNGITVQAIQVQYTSNHTRIELVIENSAAGGGAYVKDAYVIQNGSTYQQLIGVPELDLYQIRNAIEPGQSEDGFIFFNPISQAFPAKFDVVIETPAVSGPTDSTFVFQAG